ncbi:hypothetical protein CLV80_110107 [Yoonia maritima]|uniref:Uncharacterized protein n=1 Tax=Yoonia maritima TaxID=1435347 RepID=A0A2T0VW80_9RHOB|nr:hypothetical protein [Yoonia maritima]PRY76021.1 hypothetical protein CLV80_110107 [Yoonia maritima]
MADDRKTGQYFALLEEHSTDETIAQLGRNDDVTSHERFPDVEDILDRLAVNVRAAEKK